MAHDFNDLDLLVSFYRRENRELRDQLKELRERCDRFQDLVDSLQLFKDGPHLRPDKGIVK